MRAAVGMADALSATEAAAGATMQDATSEQCRIGAKHNGNAHEQLLAQLIRNIFRAGSNVAVITW